MSYRIKKVNELIKQEISKIIEREVGSDFGFLTITDVCTSPDLRLADVWLSVYKKNVDDLNELLNQLTPKIQKNINQCICLKYVPKITLKIDKSTDYALEIERTLKKIKIKK